MAEKPNPECEDPVALAAIKDAEERMGDFKLKSADDYTVPDHLRMNTDKARWRLILMKEKVRFLSLLLPETFEKEIRLFRVVNWSPLNTVSCNLLHLIVWQLCL